MPTKKPRPNLYLTGSAIEPTTSSANRYLVAEYRCPNPDCEGRTVQTNTMSLATWRGQRATWPYLLSDTWWKLFFVDAGAGAIVLITLLWALTPSVSSVTNALAVYTVVVILILIVFAWYYLLSPKIQLRAYRCRRCRYSWVEYSSPIAALRQWAEGEMKRASKRGKKEEIAAILVTFCHLATRDRNWQLTESYARQSLQLSQESKSEKTAAHARSYLGFVAFFRGRYQDAASQFETCLAEFRKLKEWRSIAYSLNNVGLARLYQGTTEGSPALFAESLSFTAKMHDMLGMSWTCAGMAGLATLQNQPERAARLYGASQALNDELGEEAQPLDDCPGFNQSVAATRGRLGDAKYEEAWQAGYEMPLADVIAYCWHGTEQAQS